MSGIDLAVLAVIAISAIVGLARGFAKEIVSLLTWLFAIGITLSLTARFATLLPPAIESPTARAAVSAITLFLASMLIGSLVSWLFGKAAPGFSFGFVNRLLGACFGIGRGLVIVTLLVLAANLAPAMKRELWWRESLLLPRFQVVARHLHAHLPPEIGQHFDFSESRI